MKSKKIVLFLTSFLLALVIMNLTIAGEKDCLLTNPEWCCNDDGWIIDYGTERCCNPDYPFHYAPDDTCWDSKTPTSNNYYSERSECEYIWDIPSNTWDIEERCEESNYYICQKNSLGSFIDGWENRGEVIGECGVVNMICNIGDWECRGDYGLGIGTLQYECISDGEGGSLWRNRGEALGECGLECGIDSHCDDDTIETSCSGNNIETKTISYTCTKPNCIENIETSISETCEFGCEEVVGVPTCSENDTPVIPGDFNIATPLIIGIAVIMILLVVGGIFLLARKK